MTLPKDGKLLRIFIGEDDKHEKMPLYEWIVRKAREEELAGATVIRGLEGYGAHSRLHTAKVLRLSSDLPVVIEIVDTAEKIESFLPLVDAVIGEGLATVEKVERLIYISEYKRFQSAPGARLTLRAFWLDRRYPIVNRWRDRG